MEVTDQQLLHAGVDMSITWSGVSAGLSASALVVAGAVVHVPVAQAADSLVVVAAAADTYVNAASPASNYGPSTTLIATDNSGWRKRMLIRFDLGAQAPTDVTHAELIVSRDAKFPGAVEVRPVLGEWSESTTTWDSQPQLGDVTASATPAADAGQASVDVTSLVRSSTDSTVDVAVTTPATASPLRIWSREAGSTGPTLQLTLANPGPTPSPTATSSCDPSGAVFDRALVPSCGVLWGVAAGAFTADQGPVAHRGFESLTGRSVGVYHYYYRGDTKFPSAREIELAREPGRPRTLFLNWKVAVGYTWAQVAAGQADARIDAEAEYLKRNFTDPFFLAVHHEPEDDVVATAGSGMTASDYSAMVRHTIERLRSRGVSNVISVLSLIGYSRWAVQPWFDALYPGDDVVDWVGWDPYAVSSSVDKVWPGPDLKSLVSATDGLRYPDGSAYQGMYRHMVSRHPGKPLMLAEWGLLEKLPAGQLSASHKKVFFDSVAAQIGQFPALKAMVYFETPDDQVGQLGHNTLVDDTAANLASFRALSADPRFVNPPAPGTRKATPSATPTPVPTSTTTPSVSPTPTVTPSPRATATPKTSTSPKETPRGIVTASPSPSPSRKPTVGRVPPRQPAGRGRSRARTKVVGWRTHARRVHSHGSVKVRLKVLPRTPREGALVRRSPRGHVRVNNFVTDGSGKASLRLRVGRSGRWHFRIAVPRTARYASATTRWHALRVVSR